MSYNLETVNDCTKKFVFNFESVNLNEEIETALKKKQESSTLKGFRKGKAPITVIKQMYASQVEYEALNKFIQKEFISAIQKEELRTVGYPEFQNTNYEQEKQAVSFDVTVEVFPEVEIKDYSGLSFSKEKVEVKDEEIEKLKANYLNSKAEMVALEGDNATVEDGRFAIINFEGELEDGSRPENMKGSDYQLEIGSKTFIPGFEEELAGLKVGDKKDFVITFPEDYHAEELKGAKTKFFIEILEVKEKKLPELTDELAKEFGFESADDFEKKNKENLTTQKERQVKEKLHQEILEKLVELNKFDIPKSLVTQQEEHVRNDLKQTLTQQGFTEKMAADYFDKWGADVTQKAEFQVRSGLILNKLAEEFNIEIADSDLDAKYEEMASMSGMGIDEVKGYYGKNEQLKSNLRYAIREEKTFEQLVSKVKVS